MRQCPRCASEITKNDKVCPRCKLPVDKMNFSESLYEDEEKNSEVIKTKKQLKKEAKLKKKEEKLQRKKEESAKKTDFSKYATNAKKDDNYLNQPKSKKLAPKFEIDENGEFNIDTADVELVGEARGKIIEEKYQKEYSVKKARGDYREPKIKWWELYKLADRSFARRKIKKEVNKAAKIRPENISKAKMLLLAIFLGFTGAHSYYAKNYKKGTVSLVTLFLWVGVVYLASFVPFFASIQVSIGGGAGFVNLIMWASDIINIAFGSYKYRTQKEAFIFSMNIKTRAKLGEKWIDEDLYRKPFYVKFKLWCQKKKRNYEEWKHDRRQRLIEKEKAKQAKKAEQEKIDAEIREYEEKEEKKLKDLKNQLKEDNTISNISKFDGEDKSEKEDDQKDKPSKPKKAKVVVKTKKKK